MDLSQLEQFVQLFLFFFIVLNLVLWVLLLVQRVVIGKGRGFPVLKFKVRSVLILQLPFLFAAIFATVLLNNLIYLFVYLLIGVVGMVAETIYSYYWSVFFPKPVWSYKLWPLAGGFTSGVNFLAWSVGSMAYMRITFLFMGVEFIPSYLRFSGGFLISTFLIHLLLILLFKLSARAEKWELGTLRFNLLAFTIISLPIMVPAFIAGVLFGLQYLLLMIIFGIVAFLTEYLYGKYMAIMLGKKMWVYNYWTIDRKHTSPTNLFGGMVAGVLFTYLMITLTS